MVIRHITMESVMLLFQYQSIIARIRRFTIHSGFCYEEDKTFLFHVFQSLIMFERLLGPNNLFAADTVRSTTVSQKFTFFTAVIVSLNLSPTLVELFLTRFFFVCELVIRCSCYGSFFLSSISLLLVSAATERAVI